MYTLYIQQTKLKSWIQSLDTKHQTNYQTAIHHNTMLHRLDSIQRQRVLPQMAALFNHRFSPSFNHSSIWYKWRVVRGSLPITMSRLRPRSPPAPSRCRRGRASRSTRPEPSIRPGTWSRPEDSLCSSRGIASAETNQEWEAIDGIWTHDTRLSTRKKTYLSAGDEDEILRPWWIEECHFVLSLVVSSNLKTRSGVQD